MAVIYYDFDRILVQNQAPGADADQGGWNLCEKVMPNDLFLVEPRDASGLEAPGEMSWRTQGCGQVSHVNYLFLPVAVVVVAFKLQLFRSRLRRDGYVRHLREVRIARNARIFFCFGKFSNKS